MSKTISLSIEHSLGAIEARQRIEAGIAQFKHGLGSKLSPCHESWIGNRLNFEVGFMGQSCRGTLDVYDSKVKLEVELPGVLGFFASKVQSLARTRGQLLLGGHK